MDYIKQPLDIEQQLDLLKNRGLIISDENNAKETLAVVSYFRIANYLRPMETDKVTHQFKPNATFEKAVSLYEFDCSLRNLVFKAIGRIEIALRTKMIHNFSLEHGPFWFIDMTLTNDEHLFLENICGVDRELHRSKEKFIKEHFKKYDKPSFPPAWKTLEVVTFGTLSKMYANFGDTKVKKIIARSFGLPQHVILESWIASIAALRNCCAHHARLWNRSFPVTPTIPSKLRDAWIANTNIPSNKLYAQLCCIAYLLNKIIPSNTFAAELKSLTNSYPNVDVTAMGFPSNSWDSEPIWK